MAFSLTVLWLLEQLPQFYNKRNIKAPHYWWTMYPHTMSQKCRNQFHGSTSLLTRLLFTQTYAASTKSPFGITDRFVIIGIWFTKALHRSHCVWLGYTSGSMWAIPSDWLMGNFIWWKLLADHWILSSGRYLPCLKVRMCWLRFMGSVKAISHLTESWNYKQETKHMLMEHRNTIVNNNKKNRM